MTCDHCEDPNRLTLKVTTNIYCVDRDCCKARYCPDCLIELAIPDNQIHARWWGTNEGTN